MAKEKRKKYCDTSKYYIKPTTKDEVYDIVVNKQTESLWKHCVVCSDMPVGLTLNQILVLEILLGVLCQLGVKGW